MSTTVQTDHKWRTPIYGYELTQKEKKQFDYISAEEIDTHEFIRYRKQVYDLNEFMRVDGLPEESPLKKWHGYISDSFFSGILIRYDSNCERIQIGTYIS